MTKQILPGSRWWSGDNKRFKIISVKEHDGQEWVYYKDDKGAPAREYSCLMEAFLQRFNSLPE